MSIEGQGMSQTLHDQVLAGVAGSGLRAVSTLAIVEDRSGSGSLNGASSAESVRIFHPDEIIHRPPSTGSSAANPLKSSIKTSSSVSGSHGNSVKTEEKPPREAGRSNLTNSTIVAPYAADTKRGHHQRFPSTGLSLPSGRQISNDARSAQNEKRSSSHTLSPKSTSSATFTRETPANTTTYTNAHTRGHRRQPSTGREQKQVNFCPYDGYCFVLDETRCAICMEERGSLPAPANVTGAPWKKILYEKQGFEDNYTDRDTFLAELKKNVNVVEYSYKLVMADSLVVTQQLSIVTLFVAVFMHTLNGTLDGNTLGVLDILTAMSGYIIWAVCQSPGTGSSSGKLNLLTFGSIMKLIGYSVGLYVISPVLAALTDPISDDTIATLSILLLVIHLSFQDYGYLNPESPHFELKKSLSNEAVEPSRLSSPTKTKTPRTSNGVNMRSRTGSAGEIVPFSNTPATPLYHAPVSLNAAIFASLLMASRLRSHSHAFVIISFAVELFALFPIMAHHLKARSRIASLIVVTILEVFAVVLLWPLSRTVTYIFISTIFFTTFISPFCLQWIQRYKNEIHGPWDEAVPARARRHGTRN